MPEPTDVDPGAAISVETDGLSDAVDDGGRPPAISAEGVERSIELHDAPGVTADEVAALSKTADYALGCWREGHVGRDPAWLVTAERVIERLATQTEAP